MNRWKSLSIGLAMSLMLTQVSYANVFITPLGTTVQVQESTAAAESTAATETAGAVENAGETVFAGAVTVTEPGAMSQATEQVTTGQNIGPGVTMQVEMQVVKPSASYSTKEPAAVAKKEQNQAAAAGQTQGLGMASNLPTQGPGVSSVSGGAGTAAETVTEIKTETVKVDLAEPVISAESVILYDVTHDRVLYEKNADTKRYPASITKIMTALLVLEHAKMDEMVTYSKTAVTKLESGAVTLSLQEGDKVSVKDSLYGLMLKSANEVANGLAEHVGGSIAGFADMMNAKAKALGCTGTHFVNPNGLNNSDHYTTARDMAKIAKAAFENETLCKITSTPNYKFPATKAVGARTLTMGHKMVHTSDSRYYEGIVGGKTGYTSLAGNTLVTCVERDGVRMIAVILKSRSSHYPDTKALFDYGYELEKLQACGSVGTAMYGIASSAANQSTETVTETEAVYHKWVADGDRWYFQLADGSWLSNCFVTIDGVEYAFDANGVMVTGWLSLGQNWHYFGNSGGMVKSGWRQDGAYWFYLGAEGAMLRNTWVDDQYYVGADGVWIEQQ